MTGRVVALSGGIGGAKLALGLDRLLAPGQLTVVANPGDDFEHLGLTVCPDLDTLMYTLAGEVDYSRTRTLVTYLAFFISAHVQTTLLSASNSMMWGPSPL